MAAGPGRIAREFTELPKTRDSDPLAAQGTDAFKDAVVEVGHAFREVETLPKKKG
jgi:hypothetical protein